jgi:SAM-dependent methyltransferase
MDVYVVRTSILRRLCESLPAFHGTVLDVGCGYQPYRQLILKTPGVTKYIGLDFPNSGYGVPDLTWDGGAIPMADGTVDSVVATEVLEHCDEPQRLLLEIWRVLRPGGCLFLTVPFLWPVHCVPHDQYRYTPFALSRMLCAADFVDLKIGALGGWDASLAQMLGLWARRRPMPRFVRWIVGQICRPIVFWLQRRDWCPNVFDNDAMITGLFSLAKKPGAQAS